MKPEHKEYILNNIDKLSVKRMSQVLNIKAKTIWEFLEHHKKNEAPPDVSPQKTEIPAKKKSSFPPFILIIILGFAVYGNSLGGQFLWDDDALVKTNTFIKSPSNLPAIFAGNMTIEGGRKWNFYRPLQMATYMIDYSLWKLNPKGYHLTNILLHVLAALSLYYLVYRLFNDNLLALLTGIFFVVHPVHTEAVTYISGRADSLALLFMLSCFLLYLKSPPSKNIGIVLLMLLSYAAALLSKEISLILPILLLLYHYSFKEKLKIKEFSSVASLALIYILLRVTFLKTPSIAIAHPTTLMERLPSFLVAVNNYTGLLLFPFDLHMEYEHKLFSLGDPRAVLGIMILFASLFFAFKQKKSSKLVFFSIAWFFLALLPVSNLFPINAYMAEHWLYLPSIGFFIIAAKAISAGATGRLPAGKAGSPLLKTLTIIFAVCLLAFYSYLTVRQNTYWQDPIRFYKRTLTYAPNSSRVYYNLGLAYRAIDKNEEAIASLKEVIKIDADDAGAYHSLGVIYTAMDKKDEAISSYEKAIDIDPDFLSAYDALGNMYLDTGEKEAAEVTYKKALEIKPDDAKIHMSLGAVYSAMDRNDEAIVFYKKAIEIKAKYTEAYYNLGNLYKDMGKKEDAAAAYKKAIEINPAFTNAYFGLGDVYTDMGKKEEAMAAYKKVVGFKDGSLNANAYNSLGVVYAAANKTEEAIASYKKAIEINSNNAKAYYNLGNIYNNKGRKEEALAAYKKVIEIKPDHAEAHNNLGNVYADMKRKEEAVASYKKAIEIKTDFIDAYNNLGNIYTSMDRKDEAEALLKKAIELKPDYAVAYSNLSIIYFKKKQYPLAVEYFKKAEELGFVHPPLLEALKPYR